MATDVAAVRAKVQQERDLLASMVALIDYPVEQARMDTAEADYRADPSHLRFKKASERWNALREKQDRLIFLEAQIALFTP